MQLKEERGRGVFIADVTEAYVSSPDEVFDMMRRGAANRVVSATRMNEESSRSHSIFMLTLSQKDLKTFEAKTGKLFLVDLAGSEKVKKTQASGQQLEEAKNINKSLSALGNVINALTDGKSTHVPYRDSKLTRLLQDSLGGNSRTTLIINASIATYNEFETISTLRFGNRAKNIKNNAKVNKELSVRELQALLDIAEKEIAKQRQYIAGLEDELKLIKNGGVIPVSSSASSSASSTSNSSASSTVNFEGVDIDSLPNVAKLRDEISDLEDKLRENEDEKNKLQEEKDIIQDQYTEKFEELQKKTAALTALEQAYHELKEKLAEIERENEFVVNKLADFTFVKEKLEFEIREKAMTIQTLTATNESLNQELESLKTSLATLRLQMVHGVKDRDPSASNSSTSSSSSASTTSVAAANAAMQAEPIDDKVLKNWDKQKAENKIQEENYYKSLQEKIMKLEGISAQQQQQQQPQQQANSNVPSASPSSIAELESYKQRETELLKKIADLEEKISQISMLNQMTQDLEEEEEEKKKKQHEEVEEEEKARKEEELRKQESLSMTEDDSIEKQVEKLRAQLELSADSHKKELASKDQEIQSLKEDHKWQLSKMTASFQNQMSFMQGVRTEKEQADKEKEEVVKKLERELEAARRETKTVRDDMMKQKKEFEQLRTALLKDLQNRIEKVIDLEMSLDEAREEYRQLAINNNSKALKKKVIFLEKSNEQITKDFQQLYNQHSSTKLELQLAEKKLSIRNDRIANLEFLLEDSKEMAKAQAENFSNEKAKFMQEMEHYRSEIAGLQDTIMRIQSGAPIGGFYSGSNSPVSATGSGTPPRPLVSNAAAVANRTTPNKGLQHVTTSKIVKPLRGGGGNASASSSATTTNATPVTMPAAAPPALIPPSNASTSIHSPPPVPSLNIKSPTTPREQTPPSQNSARKSSSFFNFFKPQQKQNNVTSPNSNNNTSTISTSSSSFNNNSSFTNNNNNNSSFIASPIVSNNNNNSSLDTSVQDQISPVHRRTTSPTRVIHFNNNGFMDDVEQVEEVGDQSEDW